MNNRQLVYLGVGFVLLFAAVCLSLLAKGEPEQEVSPGVGSAMESAGSVDAGVTALVAHAVDAGKPPAAVVAPVEVPLPAIELAAVDGERSLDVSDLTQALAAVGKIVDQCFADMTKRYPGQHTVTLSFEVRADGERARMSKPEVAATSLKDPYFEACVTDAPLDVTVPLRAVGASRVRVPYRYPAARE